MDKTAIKNFSITARKLLIQSVKDKATLIGFTKDGIKEPEPSSTQNIQFFSYPGGKMPYSLNKKGIEQRKVLIDLVRHKEKFNGKYETIYESIIEEVAYTWFNRLIAIRFMEVNGFLPSGVRVLSGDDGKTEPEMAARPFDTDMEFTEEERNMILELKAANRQDELFEILFIKQCNTLNLVLPGLFERINDYTELLLNISFTDTDGVVSKLINNISEGDFKEAVEIVGWLYQYYNTELKDDVFEALKTKNTKISKEKIPAATQLFTPDWIVRYMVENSLGRLWLEGHPNDSLKSKWKYYLDEAEQTPEVMEQLKVIRADREGLIPEGITFMDPCMGSGHILVYAFEVLMQIYESVGYTQKDASKLILEKNLYGLDIDKRAYQLSYFALMMCARKYDKRFFESKTSPQVYHPQGYRNGENYGSLIKKINENMLGDKPKEEKSDIITYAEYEINLRIWNFNKLLSINYDVVCTNPPYMGASGMNITLAEYAKLQYPDSKGDMSTVFMEKTLELCKTTGYVAMINIPVWMFLSSYEKLRYKIFNNNTFVTMLHFGRGIFGADFGTTAFVIKKLKILSYVAEYRRLFMKQGAVDNIEKKEQWFFEGIGNFTAAQEKFLRIPGAPLAYWTSDQFILNFEKGVSVDSLSDFTGSQHKTADNEKFLRSWWEVSNVNIGGSRKWQFYTKGGDFRRWYGNIELIIDWSPAAIDFYKNNTTSNLLAEKYRYKEGITYTSLSSSINGFRYLTPNSIFDIKGPSLIDVQHLYYILALLNTKIATLYLKTFNSTITLQVKDVKAIPIILDNSIMEEVENTSKSCVNISKIDWDSFETSQDFQSNPLVSFVHNVSKNERLAYNDKPCCFKDVYESWEHKVQLHWKTLKNNEEKLNRIFIDVYGLKNELTSEVDDEYVTIRKADLGHDIRSFISYAVGCMFGRYSLDVEGLAYAGGEWDANKYSSFIPFSNNVIPITDEEYFKDDIVTRFVEFVRIVYGEKTLEENLDFIAKSFDIKGNSSRDIIRNYFLKEFYKDHLKVYQKRPIYWLFDSGKENGFKALIYLHRYDPDTVGKLRVDYLNRLQDIYDKELGRMQNTINTSTDNKDISDASKRLEKLNKQIAETRGYDALVGHLAVMRISLNLDDGVKVNYEKLQTAGGKKYEVLGKI